MLYPCIRIKADNSTGTGAIIYSKPRDKDSLYYDSFAITNWHVIQSAIHVAEDWDPSMAKKITREKNDPVKIEKFSYIRWSVPDGSGEGFDGQIIAYSKDLDVAVLKIESSRKFEFTAKLYPKDRWLDLKVFDEVMLIGCTLGEPPLHTKGEISAVDKRIQVGGDWRQVWQVNALSLPGNSGGACYKIPEMACIGLLAYGVRGGEFLSFIVPMSRIYDWMDQEGLWFLYDPSKTPGDFEKHRAAKRAANQQK